MLCRCLTDVYWEPYRYKCSNLSLAITFIFFTNTLQKSMNSPPLSYIEPQLFLYKDDFDIKITAKIDMPFKQLNESI